ncbi:hypothetical protein BT69DRAFT_1217371, partial [Atractiella rhizophila]
PQQIVATRLLYCLQHPVPIQVVCKGFIPAHISSSMMGSYPSVSARTAEPEYGTRAQGPIRTHLTCTGQTSSLLAWVLA